jgi:hypothetical protein
VENEGSRRLPWKVGEATAERSTFTTCSTTLHKKMNQRKCCTRGVCQWFLECTVKKYYTPENIQKELTMELCTLYLSDQNPV